MQIERWVGFDLDGTIAEYRGWKGVEHIGKPIPSMIHKMETYLVQGVKVKVFTARIHNQPDAIPPIRKWLDNLGFKDVEITNIKDQGMIKLYDDRAVQVISNEGVVI